MIKKYIFRHTYALFLFVCSMVAFAMLIISFNIINGHTHTSWKLQSERRSFFRPTLKHDENQYKEDPHGLGRPDSNEVVSSPSIRSNPTTSTKLDIPPNFVINTKSGTGKEPLFIQNNILNNWGYFPGWALISDNDITCLDKIKKTNVFNNSEISMWYASNDTRGMYKSDVCRLAQLYLDGGVYLDNDLELTSSLLDILKGPVDIVSAVSLGGNDIFQAIFAAPPGHQLLLRSMEIMSSILFEGRKNKSDYLGPGAAKMAIDELYNISDLTNRTELAREGVYLYREIQLPSSHPMMKHRNTNNHCNVAFSGIDDNNISGFSRVKEWGTTNKPCHMI